MDESEPQGGDKKMLRFGGEQRIETSDDLMPGYESRAAQMLQKKGSQTGVVLDLIATVTQRGRRRFMGVPAKGCDPVQKSQTFGTARTGTPAEFPGGDPCGTAERTRFSLRRA